MRFILKTLLFCLMIYLSTAVAIESDTNKTKFDSSKQWPIADAKISLSDDHRLQITTYDSLGTAVQGNSSVLYKGYIDGREIILVGTVAHNIPLATNSKMIIELENKHGEKAKGKVLYSNPGEDLAIVVIDDPSEIAKLSQIKPVQIWNPLQLSSNKISYPPSISSKPIKTVLETNSRNRCYKNGKLVTQLEHSSVKTLLTDFQKLTPIHSRELPPLLPLAYEFDHPASAGMSGCFVYDNTGRFLGIIGQTNSQNKAILIPAKNLIETFCYALLKKLKNSQKVSLANNASNINFQGCQLFDSQALPEIEKNKSDSNEKIYIEDIRYDSPVITGYGPSVYIRENNKTIKYTTHSKISLNVVNKPVPPGVNKPVPPGVNKPIPPGVSDRGTISLESEKKLLDQLKGDPNYHYRASFDNPNYSYEERQLFFNQIQYIIKDFWTSKTFNLNTREPERLVVYPEGVVAETLNCKETLVQSLVSPLNDNDISYLRDIAQYVNQNAKLPELEEKKSSEITSLTLTHFQTIFLGKCSNQTKTETIIKNNLKDWPHMTYAFPVNSDRFYNGTTDYLHTYITPRISQDVQCKEEDNQITISRKSNGKNFTDYRENLVISFQDDHVKLKLIVTNKKGKVIKQLNMNTIYSGRRYFKFIGPNITITIDASHKEHLVIYDHKYFPQQATTLKETFSTK